MKLVSLNKSMYFNVPVVKVEVFMRYCWLLVGLCTDVSQLLICFCMSFVSVMMCFGESSFVRGKFCNINVFLG